MDLTPFFKSVLEQDRAPIVLCDLAHTIIYMNPAAVRQYAKRGGAALMGQNLMNCHSPKSAEIIERAVRWFSDDTAHNIVYEFRNDEENKDVYMVALRDEDGVLIGYYEKHEYRNRETMKLYDFSE
ncbi:MAG: PAS domain-containing protein [Clostridia bacterium]|nr:PAS domain-containing protein [Clostridia bacterium]